MKDLSLGKLKDRLYDKIKEYKKEELTVQLVQDAQDLTDVYEKDEYQVIINQAAEVFTSAMMVYMTNSKVRDAVDRLNSKK